MIRSYSIYLSVILLLACSRSDFTNVKNTGKTASEDSPPQNPSGNLELRDYVRYVENPANGLNVSKEVQDMVYTLQYKPLPYVIALEEMNDTLFLQHLGQRETELKDMQYFTLRLEAKNNSQELLKYNLSDEEQYYERVKYFSFDMQRDIYLRDGNDSLPCLLYHFERTYGAAPYAKFVLGFVVSKANRAVTKEFVFNDRAFNGGSIHLKISDQDIKRVPQVKTY